LKEPRAKAPTIGPFGSPIKEKNADVSQKAVVSESRWMSGDWREVAIAGC